MRLDEINKVMCIDKSRKFRTELCLVVEDVRWNEQRRVDNKEGGKPGVHGVLKAKGRKLFNKDVRNVKCAESSTMMNLRLRYSFW